MDLIFLVFSYFEKSSKLQKNIDFEIKHFFRLKAAVPNLILEKDEESNTFSFLSIDASRYKNFYPGTKIVILEGTVRYDPFRERTVRNRTRV